MERQGTCKPLLRAAGLIVAQSAIQHWWMQRLSAVALVPLSLWFTAAIIAHSGADYAAAIAWLRNPITCILMVLLLVALFYHTALGLQVIVEDYVHSRAKTAALIVVRLGCFAVGVSGVAATLRIALGSQ
jgi:succinate dehydrogenase / fumarate reductase membrane anchor subunit